MIKPLKFFRHLSLKKKLVLIGVSIIVIGIVLSILGGAASQKKYTLVKVEKSEIVEIVSETGTIATSGRTDVYSPTNGTVVEVEIKNGDTVKTGQTLLTIKSSATEQEKAQALASYLAAKNVLDTAQATMLSLQATMFSEWDTFKQLAESDKYEEGDGKPKTDKRALPEFLIAEKDWLAAESNYKKQQAVISQAQAGVSNTYLSYQATQNAIVKATTDGTISNLSVTSGNTVKINSVASPTTPLVIIVGLSSTEVLVSLSENDIAKVKEGQEVSIDANAVHGTTYNGIVKRVDTIGTSLQGVIRYNVYIEVTNADNRLRPGMKADVVITTNKIGDALAVPNAAVKPYQGGRAVRVPDQKKNDVKYIPVEIGIRGKEKTQILSGIDEGQMVISSLSNEQIKRPGLFGN